MVLNEIDDAFIGSIHIDEILLGEISIWPPKIPVDDYSCLLIDGAVNTSHKGSFVFETDYHPNRDTRIEMYYQYTKGSGDVYYSIFKCTNADNLQDMGARVPRGTSWQVGCWGTSRSLTFNTTNAKPSLGRFKLIMDAYKAILETPSGEIIEKQYSNSPTIISLDNTPLHIGCWTFTRNADGSLNTVKRSALGYYGVIRIFEGNTLMREYIPYEDKNGIACYYDTVTKKEMYLETLSELTVTKTTWAK